MLWASVVDMLQAVFFAVAHVFNGSLGWAIVAVSFALRLALLPLTLRMARRALEHQERLLALQPEVERLRRRHANDQAAQWRELTALYKRRGVTLLDPAIMLGGLAQTPIYAAMFAALRKGVGAGVRFLWVRDLASPNAVLALIVAAITAAGLALVPSPDPARRVALVPLLIAGAITFWFLSTTSAAFALASGSASLVNVYQSILVRRATASNVHRPIPRRL